MEQFLQAETLIIELLLLVAVVAIIVQRLRIPYTVALVIVGLLFTFQPNTRFTLTPELILALFVPPLVFEAAFHVSLEQLRRKWQPILALAVPGVLFTTFGVGWLVSMGVGIALPVALLFGALIAATDPVAVVALFRSLGAPRGLITLIEGESLFNDGTAIVIFNAMLAVALTGQFNLTASLGNFLVVSLGGIAVGAVLGAVVSRVIAAIDDYLIETTLTTVLAFGSYLLAERLHLSGVLAVVAAGIMGGNFGPRGMSPTTRIVLFNFWEYLAFVANSMIFLLIGLQVDLPRLAEHAWPIAVAVVAVLLTRFIVYVLAWPFNRRANRIPLNYQHVMFWGGQRGAISLALALSIPLTIAERDLLIVMTFGVVLFTLLIQGTTMQFLLKRLGMVGVSQEDLAYERVRGRLLAVRASHDRLRQLHREGLIAPNVWEALGPQLEAAETEQAQTMRDLLIAHPELEAQEAVNVRREGLRAQRSAVDDLLRLGLISEDVHSELINEIDREIDSDSPQLLGVRPHGEEVSLT